MAVKDTGGVFEHRLAISLVVLLLYQASVGEGSGGCGLDTDKAANQQRGKYDDKNCFGTSTEKGPFVRKLQQGSDEVPTCTWAFGECTVNTFEKVHDVHTTNYLLAFEVCGRIVPTEADCRANLHCLWYGADCRQDYLFYLQDCVEPEWLTLYRALLCSQFPHKEKCEIIGGCFWNEDAGLCTEDFDEVAKDIGSNMELRTAFEKFAQCQNKTTCDDFCTPGEGGTCDYTPLRDPVNWFLDPPPSQHCELQLQLHKCLDSTSCDAPCELHTDGTCGMDFHGKDVIRLLHDETPKLRKTLLKAANKCPKLKSESECESYGN